MKAEPPLIDTLCRALVCRSGRPLTGNIHAKVCLLLSPMPDQFVHKVFTSVSKTTCMEPGEACLPPSYRKGNG